MSELVSVTNQTFKEVGFITDLTVTFRAAERYSSDAQFLNSERHHVCDFLQSVLLRRELVLNLDKFLVTTAAWLVSSSQSPAQSCGNENCLINAHIRSKPTRLLPD
ncbi:hypothetical protein QAD02_003231 [Eretmocerus hayati]|uniref:Uncharacterized protein n=1 Tax=Eretmocerus hayati TaxID=131215 RepID=A0ACC2NLH6_9HYME|nr:hypothetical protein QAD02_003231 [Eretmocerus hayati]